MYSLKPTLSGCARLCPVPILVGAAFRRHKVATGYVVPGDDQPTGLAVTMTLDGVKMSQKNKIKCILAFFTGMLCACDDPGSAGVGEVQEGDPRLDLLEAEDEAAENYTPIQDLASPERDPLAAAICTGWPAGGRTCVTQCSAEPGLWHSTGAKYPAINYGDCSNHANWWCAVTGRGYSTWPCWGFPVY